MASGEASKLHTYFHWPMKPTGFSMIMGAGLQSHRLGEEQSILYRMGSCFDVIFMGCLTVMIFPLILMYAFYFFKKL